MTLTEQCAAMVLKSMRTTSKPASTGYLAAAQFFALTWEKA